MAKKKKYAYGGKTMDIPTPQESLFDMIRNSEESIMEGQGKLEALKGIGGMLTSTGMSMMNSGISEQGGLENFFKNGRESLGGRPNWNGIDFTPSTGTATKRTFAYGGEVEVEGNEVGYTPSGKLVQFKGPSHEDGGIDVNLPEGTEIFSKRIKVDGETMAERKKKRERYRAKIESYLGKDSIDQILKNTAERVNTVVGKENTRDMDVQKMFADAQKQLNEPVEKFALGGITPGGPLQTLLSMEYLDPMEEPLWDNGEPINYGKTVNGKEIPEVTITAKKKELPLKGRTMDVILPSSEPITGPDLIFDRPVLNTHPTLPQEVQPVTPTESKGSGILDYLKNADFNLGDGMAMAGTLYNTLGLKANVLANRRGDTPNINPYKNYGDKALQSIEDSLANQEYQKDEALQDAELNRQGTINRNNLNTRSLSTLRAMNLAADAQFNNAEDNIYAKNAELLQRLYLGKADTQLKIDDMKMRGEEIRDMNDRKDRDAFFQNMNAAINNTGKGIQQLGQNLNLMKQARVTSNLANQLSRYFNIDSKGHLHSKTVEDDTTKTTEPTARDMEDLMTVLKKPDNKTTQAEIEKLLEDNPILKTTFGLEIPKTVTSKKAKSSNSSANITTSDVGTERFKSRLAQTESDGRYNLHNKSGKGAFGKYQFKWKYHGNDIMKVTGVKDQNEFLNDKNAQEKFMDYKVKESKNFVSKYIKKIQERFPEITMEDAMMLYHYRPKNITEMADGTITSLDYIPGASEKNKSIGYYLYGNKYKGVKTN